MRRRAVLWAILLGLAALSAGLAGMLAGRDETASAMPECPTAPPIVLDPGHGGIDGGTNRQGVLEKDIVLDVALRTRQYLERYHIPVVLTRSEDVDLGGDYDMGRLRRDLNFRIRVANRCNAALMISLHVNASRNSSERGVMIFYQPARPSRDAALHVDSFLRRWPLHERQERPIARKDLAVLKTKAPAILVEMGFMTNEEDRRRLQDEAYRNEMARALAAACVGIYYRWVPGGQ